MDIEYLLCYHRVYVTFCIILYVNVYNNIIFCYCYFGEVLSSHRGTYIKFSLIT